MKILDFGIKDYDEILCLQKRLVKLKSEGKEAENFLLIGEHFHVITLGKRPKQEANLKVDLKEVDSKNIKIRKVHRGGFATYHGPGQIVGYPIIDLRRNNLGIKTFIEKLEEVLISTLEHFNIHGIRKPGYIGIWVDENKIASIGVGIKRSITFHGFSLNVNTDLSYFDYIIPCGLNGVKMTSLEKEMEKKVSIKDVKHICIKQISKVFNNPSTHLKYYEDIRLCEKTIMDKV